ncbi:hypothetical protein DB30_02888 [Enhygromyxa salina]|uniref:Uncharacterized protein n=1 Tax=Enhygromyxa salina TaxID=215803 RepID=A0A0C1Z2J9_9BACT|nr:hypothetical protein DB30_02888 [Enhygromyxa salina]
MLVGVDGEDLAQRTREQPLDRGHALAGRERANTCGGETLEHALALAVTARVPVPQVEHADRKPDAIRHVQRERVGEGAARRVAGLAVVALERDPRRVEQREVEGLATQGAQQRPGRVRLGLERRAQLGLVELARHLLDQDHGRVDDPVEGAKRLLGLVHGPGDRRGLGRVEREVAQLGTRGLELGQLRPAARVERGSPDDHELRGVALGEVAAGVTTHRPEPADDHVHAAAPQRDLGVVELDALEHPLPPRPSAQAHRCGPRPRGLGHDLRRHLCVLRAADVDEPDLEARQLFGEDHGEADEPGRPGARGLASRERIDVTRHDLQPQPTGHDAATIERADQLEQRDHGPIHPPAQGRAVLDRCGARRRDEVDELGRNALGQARIEGRGLEAPGPDLEAHELGAAVGPLDADGERSVEPLPDQQHAPDRLRPVLGRAGDPPRPAADRGVRRARAELGLAVAEPDEADLDGPTRVGEAELAASRAGLADVDPAPRGHRTEQLDAVDREGQHRSRLSRASADQHRREAVQGGVEDPRVQGVLGLDRRRAEAREDLVVPDPQLLDPTEEGPIVQAHAVEHGVEGGPGWPTLERALQPLDGERGRTRATVDEPPLRAQLAARTAQLVASSIELDLALPEPGTALDRDAQRPEPADIGEHPAVEAAAGLGDEIEVADAREDRAPVDDMIAEHRLARVELPAPDPRLLALGLDLGLDRQRSSRLRAPLDPVADALERVRGQGHALGAPLAPLLEIVDLGPVEADAADPHPRQQLQVAGADLGGEKFGAAGARRQHVGQGRPRGDASVNDLGPVLAATEGREGRGCAGEIAGDEGQALGQGLPTDAQRVADIGEPTREPALGVTFQGRADRRSVAAQPVLVAGRDQHQLGPGRRAGLGRREVLLDDHVSVGPARAERADGGPARDQPARCVATLGPRRRLALDSKRRARKIDERVEPLGVERRQQHALAQLQRDLGQSGDTGRPLEVADRRLDRSEGTKTELVGVLGEGLGEAGVLDRIAERGPGPVGLDAADRPRVDPGAGQGLLDESLLRVGVGHGEAARAPAVVDGRRTDHRVDRVSVAHGLGQPLEHDRAHALTGHVAAGVGPERAAASVG